MYVRTYVDCQAFYLLLTRIDTCSGNFFVYILLLKCTSTLNVKFNYESDDPIFTFQCQGLNPFR